MQLDYKDIIIKHYALSMSGSEIARQTGSNSAVQKRNATVLLRKSGRLASQYASLDNP